MRKFCWGNLHVARTLTLALAHLLPLAAEAAIVPRVTGFMLEGEIRPGDDAAARKILESLRPGKTVNVYMNSEGGDVPTAMRIGRLLRSHEARVFTIKCLSSCVLAFVGGVERESGRIRLGVHRLYFTRLPSGLTTQDIASRRQLLLDEISSYLREMRIAPRLLDMMEATPPEKMHVLSDAEISDLGLDAPDPVWDEKVVARAADIHGIASQEYRKRRATASTTCKHPPGYLSLPARQLEDIGQRLFDCEQSLLWGISVEEYNERDRQYDAWIRTTSVFKEVVMTRRPTTPNEQEFFRVCLVKFMVQGAHSCE